MQPNFSAGWNWEKIESRYQLCDSNGILQLFWGQLVTLVPVGKTYIFSLSAGRSGWVLVTANWGRPPWLQPCIPLCNLEVSFLNLYCKVHESLDLDRFVSRSPIGNNTASTVASGRLFQSDCGWKEGVPVMPGVVANLGVLLFVSSSRPGVAF